MFGKYSLADIEAYLLEIIEKAKEKAEIGVLFTLLNERLTQRRHTVVATNLSVLELKELYSERVFSRLFDTVNVMPAQLKGKDLRMMAGRGGN